MRRLWVRLTCNWFVVALHCAIRGHDYGVQYCGGPSWSECQAKGVRYTGPTHRLFVCRWCGDFNGQQRI